MPLLTLQPPQPLSINSTLNLKEKKKTKNNKTWLVLKYLIHLVEVLVILTLTVLSL